MAGFNNDELYRLEREGIPVTRVTKRAYDIAVPAWVPRSPRKGFNTTEIDANQKLRVEQIQHQLIRLMNETRTQRPVGSGPLSHFEELAFGRVRDGRDSRGFSISGHNLWREVTGSSRYQTLHQQAIQLALDLNSGAEVLGLDIETIGDIRSPGAFVGITEIGLGRYKYEGGGAKGVHRLSGLNLAVKLPSQGQALLREWIEKARSVEQPLMAHERLAITRMMMYDPTKGAKINAAGRISGLADVSTILDDINLSKRRFRDDELASAMAGMEYLQKQGMTFRTAMKNYAREISYANANNMPVITANGINFDIPTIVHAAKAVNKDADELVPKRHLDMLHLFRTVPDVYKGIYRNQRHLLDTNLGELQREQIVKLLVGDQNDSIQHHAAHDVEGTVRAVFEWMDSDKTAGRKYLLDAQHVADASNPLRLHRGLKYDPREISYNDTFFSLRGRFAVGDRAEDMIVRLNPETGQYEKVDFPNMSIRGRQFYRFLGYSTIGEGDTRRHVALFNALGALDAHEEVHALVAPTHGELAERIHSNLVPWESDLNDRVARRTLAVSRQDLALRRWRRMFSTEAGGGFEALSKALQYIELRSDPSRREEFESFMGSLSPEQRRDFATMRPRLESEAPIWREVLNRIDSRGYQSAYEKNLALRIAYEEMNSILQEQGVKNSENLVNRKPTILELYDIPVLDPESKEIRTINFAHRGRAVESIMNYVYDRRKSGTQAQMEASANFEFEQFVKSLARPRRGYIDTPEGRRMISAPKLLTTSEANELIKGNTIEARARALVDFMFTNNRLERLRKFREAHGITVESLRRRPSKVINAINPEDIIDRVDRKMSMRMGVNSPFFRDWVNHYQNTIAPMGHRIGNVNVIQAIDRIKGAFSYGDANALSVSLAVSSQDPYSLRLLLHRGDPDTTAAVNEYLASISDQEAGRLPRGAAQIDIPLPDERGVIRYGNMSVIGRSKLTLDHTSVQTGRFDKLRYRVQTPLDQIVEEIASRATTIRDMFAVDDIDAASYHLSRSVRDTIQKMSGASRLADDPLDFRGNLSDVYRQFNINASELAYASALRLREQGIVTTDLSSIRDWRDTMDVLSPREQMAVLRDLPNLINTQVKEQLIAQGVHGVDEKFAVTPFGSRAEQLSNAVFSMADARRFAPFALYDKPGRENIMQMGNYLRLTTPQGLHGDFYVGQLMATNPYMDEVARQMRRGVPTHSVYATGVAIDTGTISEVLKQRPELRDRFDFLTRPDPYEQTIMMTEDMARQFQIQKTKYYDVTSLAEGLTKGTVLSPNDMIGYVSDNIEEGKYEVFDQLGQGEVAEIIERADGKFRVAVNVTRQAMEGDKFAFGTGEKATLRMMDTDLFHEVFGEGVHWAAYLDVPKHEDIGGAIQSQVNKAALAVKKGKLTEEAMMTSFQMAFGKKLRKRRGAFIVPEDLGAIKSESVEQWINFLRDNDIEYMRTLPGTNINVMTRTDEFRMMDVADRATASHMFDERSLSNVRRRMGFREFHAIHSKYYMDGNERVSLSNTLQWLEDEGIGPEVQRRARREANYLFDSIRAYIDPDVASQMPVIRPGDVGTLSPDSLYLKEQFRGTLFDEGALRQAAGGKFEGSFALKLPESVRVELKRGFQGSEVVDMDRVFMSHSSPLRLPDDRYALNEIQKAQNRIMRAIQDYEENFVNAQPGRITKGVDRIRQELQQSVQNYVDTLADTVSSSNMSKNAIFANDVVATEIAHSGIGKVQIISPHAIADNLGREWQDVLNQESTVFISRQRAKDMELEGLMDRLTDPKQGVYGIAQRFPNIHEDTIEVARFFVHDSAKADVAYMSPGLANRFNADADGDRLAMYFAYGKHLKNVTFEDVQKEWQRYWEYRQPYYMRFRDEVAGAIKNPDLLSIMRERGEISPSTSAQDVRLETEAKLGKRLIGAVSNVVQRSRSFALELRDQGIIDDDEFARVSEFARTIEQKPIDSKHLEGITKNMTMVEEPQIAQRFIDYMHNREIMRPGSEVRENFIRDFVLGEGPLGADAAMFKKSPELVESFFRTIDKDSRLWRSMNRDIFFSNTLAKQGLGAVAEQLTSGMTPNVKLTLSRLGRQEMLQNIEAGTLFRPDHVPIEPPILDPPTRMDAIQTSGGRIGDMLSGLSEEGMGRKLLMGGGIALAGLGLATMLIRMGNRGSEIRPEEMQAPMPDTGEERALVMDNNSGYPGYAVRIRANDNGRDPAELAEILGNGMNQMMPMQVNTNVFVRDDTRQMNEQWAQEILSRALETGQF